MGKQRKNRGTRDGRHTCRSVDEPNCRSRSPQTLAPDSEKVQAARAPDESLRRRTRIEDARAIRPERTEYVPRDVERRAAHRGKETRTVARFLPLRARPAMGRDQSGE